MPSRKSVVKSRCALCGAKEVSEPRGEEKYCRDCWDKKIAVEEIVARDFALKRYIRAHSAEKYLAYHSAQKRPIGQIIVVDDGYDRDLLTSYGFPGDTTPVVRVSALGALQGDATGVESVGRRSQRSGR